MIISIASATKTTKLWVFRNTDQRSGKLKRTLGNCLQIQWKMRDVFFNNGITDIFWATSEVYSVVYQDVDGALLLKPDDDVELILKPFALEIKGSDEAIRIWYRKIAEYLIDIGLTEIPRFVVDFKNGELKEGYSFGSTSFACRTWGTSVGSRFISRPSLRKKMKPKEKAVVEKALEAHILKTGMSLDSMSKEKKFKKGWQKEGVYIQASRKEIIKSLHGARYEFESGQEACEICGSNLTQGKFKRDSSVCPAAIGLDYSGFKDLMDPGKARVCAFCDLVLRYNFFWAFYAQNKPNIILHLDAPNLVGLYRLKRQLYIQMKSLTEKQNTNIPYQGFYLSSLERALLALALFIFHRTKGEADLQLAHILAEKVNFLRVYALFFDETAIYRIIEYHRFQELFDFFSDIGDVTALKTPFEKGAFNLARGERRDMYERSLLGRILNFNDLSGVLAEIAFLKIKGDIYPSSLNKDFEEVIEKFYKFLKEEKMSEEELQFLRKYGWSVGTLANSIDDKGIFYEMRDARKADHLLRVLRDFSFRLVNKSDAIRGGGSFATSALETYTGQGDELARILSENNSKNWEKARDLLAFFAVNSYLKGQKKSEEINS